MDSSVTLLSGPPGTTTTSSSIVDSASFCFIHIITILHNLFSLKVSQAELDTLNQGIMKMESAAEEFKKGYEELVRKCEKLEQVEALMNHQLVSHLSFFLRTLIFRSQSNSSTVEIDDAGEIDVSSSDPRLLVLHASTGKLAEHDWEQLGIVSQAMKTNDYLSEGLSSYTFVLSAIINAPQATQKKMAMLEERISESVLELIFEWSRSKKAFGSLELGV